MIRFPIYLDHHATTPLDPRVLDAMLPFFREQFGNAASVEHGLGRAAAQAVEAARRQVAELIGATPKEIVFTSGATESDNLALKGVVENSREAGDHLITAVTEHRAVLDTCRRLETQGVRVTYLPVSGAGLVDPDAVRRAITNRTILITLMTANNEIGVLHPIAEIGRIAREHGVLFHTDASQAAGKIPFDVDALNVDLVSLSAHKLYGPKGVGALYVRSRRPRVQLSPMLDGGGHEHGLRSGTLNVPAIVGFGTASALCRAEMTDESARLRTLRDSLNEKLHASLSQLYINGSMEHRLPHNLNVSFCDLDGESVVEHLDAVAVSSGAACSTGTIQPSHVLRALGRTDALARASVRFGLGRFNTVEEIDYVAMSISAVVSKLRNAVGL
jgi:cysteine desulfurase